MSSRRIVELRRRGELLVKYEVIRWSPSVDLRLLSLRQGEDAESAEQFARRALDPDYSPGDRGLPHDVSIAHRWENVARTE
jgi:hypothetical protein